MMPMWDGVAVYRCSRIQVGSAGQSGHLKLPMRSLRSTSKERETDEYPYNHSKFCEHPGRAKEFLPVLCLEDGAGSQVLQADEDSL